MLANIGFKVRGLACDAGGNNNWLYRLLRLGTNLPSDGWLHSSLVTFENPVIAAAEPIAMWHCSAHNLKAGRNAHLNSDVDGTRDFTTPSGIKFGWGVIKDVYQRDQKRVQKGFSPDTDLTKGAIIPDRYNKMSVKFSKAAYSYKTINEQISYISEKLGCSNVLLLKGTFDETKDVIEIYKARCNILQNAMAMATNVNELEGSFASLVYSVAIRTIDNELLLCNDRRITAGNIDKIEAFLKDALSFFEKWQISTKVRKQNGDKQWEKKGLSAITYQNMRIGARGFMEYARLILFDENPP